MSSHLGTKMIELMFRGDLELRQINFEHFMTVMFNRNMDGVAALFAL